MFWPDDVVIARMLDFPRFFLSNIRVFEHIPYVWIGDVTGTPGYVNSFLFVGVAGLGNFPYTYRVEPDNHA